MAWQSTADPGAGPHLTVACLDPNPERAVQAIYPPDMRLAGRTESFIRSADPSHGLTDWARGFVRENKPTHERDEGENSFDQRLPFNASNSALCRFVLR